LNEDFNKELQIFDFCLRRYVSYLFDISDKNTLYTLYLKIYIKYSFSSHYTSDTKNRLYDYNMLGNCAIDADICQILYHLK
jgi:hypothetical protein